MSDDGTMAIVLVALLGNPFSPGYARARDRGPSRPLDHCALNVALYGRTSSAFALEERALENLQGGNGVAIGQSSIRWEGDALVVDVDERATPFGTRLRGRVVVRPEVLTGLVIHLDAGRGHRWWPIAPLASINVEMSEPGLRFRGHGYHDANAGDGPLGSTFETWTWARGRAGDEALVTYDVRETNTAPRSLGVRFTRTGRVESIAAASVPLPRSRWGIDRTARADVDGVPRVVRDLEDGPFYVRSLVETRLMGHNLLTVHETLAAHRLRRRWVRFLTAFRMRRAA